LETLLVWQKSLAFAVEICKTVLPKLPVREKWSLVDQLRRSTQSIPANIAEGCRYIAFLKESKRGASEPGANHIREDSPLYNINTDISDSESPTS